MAKYKDHTGVGRSAIVPFQPDEPSKDRHERRLKSNLIHADRVASWCADHHVQMKVTNEGHHWQFVFRDRHFADWWPSSAKLVFYQQWERGIHVHDHEQLTEALKKRWRALKKRLR